jgi:hypothetical protein
LCLTNPTVSHLPLLRGANGLAIPSWGFITKATQFQEKLFTSCFLQAAVAGPFLGIDFLQKCKITVAPETYQVLFLALQQPQPLLLPLCVAF